MADVTVEDRLARIESLLTQLVERETVREFYDTDELAEMIGRERQTVKEWCRLGRLAGSKRQGGKGGNGTWVVSHEEYLRYRREGLRPLRA